MTPQPLGDRSDGSASPPRGASDAALLRAVAAGSEVAFEELRSRYGRAVGCVCRSVAGSEREDCEQEVFARIWSKAALFDPERGSAAAWLLTVTRRTALNLRATRRTELPDTVQAVDEVVAPPEVESFWLDGAMARLPEKERTVIELAYYRDMTESAIARRL